MLGHATSRTTSMWKSGPRPEFLEAAAKELIEERWQKVAREKLSMPTPRLG